VVDETPRDETPRDPSDAPTLAEPDPSAPSAPAPEEPTASVPPAPAPEEPPAEQASADEAPAPAEEAPAAAEEAPAPVEEAPAPVEEAPAPAEEAPAPAEEASAPVEEAPARPRPSVPGADLEVDIVPEGVDPLAREQARYDEDTPPPAAEGEEAEEPEQAPQPITAAAIDLAAGARYRATGKRKTAIARVILRPGTGAYHINGHTLEQHFPRATLLRNIRQPLETVGYEARMDVHARLHGGGISAQAGALRHGISRALLEADPNLRGELKRRGFLTRDARAKERKKAGLKKARKRPQFSKR